MLLEWQEEIQHQTYSAYSIVAYHESQSWLLMQLFQELLEDTEDLIEEIT